MNNLLNNLETDEKIFGGIIKKRLFQKIKPSIITFITPGTNFFDIFRLIKLHEFNKAGFYLLLVVEESEKQEELDFFIEIIDKFIPNNKRIFLYEDIVNNLFSNKDYKSLIFSYSINNLRRFNKYPEMNNLSLSDLNRFLTQYFILKNSKLFINQDPDFFLTTSYKDLFFNDIPSFDRTDLPVKVLLKNVFLPWNFKSSIKTLERKLDEKKTHPNYNMPLLKSALFPVESLLQNKIRNKDFLSIIFEIQKFLAYSNVKKEHFATKSNFRELLSVLNNETRRKIISILVKNKQLKAEEIKKEINLTLKKKHSLANIIKHLNLLLDLSLINKRKRFYEMGATRIVLDMPISWFTENSTKHLLK